MAKSKKAEPPSIKLPANDADGYRGLNIKDRKSPELVIGLVGAIGSGVSFVSNVFKGVFEDEFGYDVKPYKISHYIAGQANLLGGAVDPTWSKGDRVEGYQTLGNKLRKEFGRGFLMDMCVQDILQSRVDAGKIQTLDDVTKTEPWRAVHIVDSLKNPEELNRLEEIYGDRFYAVTVFAPEEVRKRRLKNLGFNDKEIAGVLVRDEHENEGYGQNVRDTAQLSDFYLRNDGDNDEKIKKEITRFLEILFSAEIHSPTQDERGMAKAAAASGNSACMSRQVGASIYDQQGELLATGFNDVPRAFGGLYPRPDGEEDNRCFRWGGEICHNDTEKDILYSSVAEALKQNEVVSNETKNQDVEAVLSKTRVRDLIEFSRSVHAEMDALMTIARSSSGTTVFGTMYTTTFPCHNCARHIVAAGISRVLYIEPYPKSLALRLHYDSISVDEKDEASKAVFLQYEGVAPKNLSKFFIASSPRKSGGKKVPVDRKNALPVYCSGLDSYITSESLVIRNLKKRIEGVKHEEEKD